MASLPENQIYVLATSLMAAFFVAAMVRLWLLRSVEEQLLKNKAALEKQVVMQQKDLMTVRQESSAWRTEMQRQFDLFRHMASDQLSVEEKRFNDLLSKSSRREFELQTALDLAKQMCAELPTAKARILHLEAQAAAAPPPPAAPIKKDDSEGGIAAPAAPVTPMPDLSGGGKSLPKPFSAPEIPLSPPKPSFFASTPTPASVPVPVPTPDNSKVTELESKLVEMEKKNSFLQQSLTMTRLRSRARPNSIRKSILKKRVFA